MRIALSELKGDIERYVNLAETEEVIITKSGKPAAKIIRFEELKKEIPEQITSWSQLFGTLSGDVDLDDLKMERITRKSGYTP